MQSVTDMAQGFFGADTLGRVSAWLHEPPARTKAAVQDALPASLLGLANQASSEEGSRELLGRLQRGDYPHLAPDELGRAVRDPATTERLVQSNQGFTEGMFGGNLQPLVDGMAKHTGASRSAISKVLAITAPFVLDMVGRRAVSQHLDARELRSYLGEQQRMAAAALPGSLKSLLVPAGATAATLDRRPERAPDRVAPRSRPWWIIGVLAAVAVVVVARDRHARWSRQAAVIPPEAVSLPLTAGDVSALGQFLDGAASPPRRFVLRDLRFTSDSADIDAAARPILDDVAGVLAAHPGAQVRIEGHTDGTGTPETNRPLSQARAETTRRYLIEHGIDPSRVEIAGLGASRPVASNDTAEGRAENRRTELVVTAR